MSPEHPRLNDAAVAIRNYIDADPLGKRTPSELIAEFHVSRKKLLPVFKELTGHTIRSYQFEQLMIAASNMLLSGMDIKEVRIECGFTDYRNNFTRSFVKKFKMGPEAWRRKQMPEGRNENKDVRTKKKYIQDNKLFPNV